MDWHQDIQARDADDGSDQLSQNHSVTLIDASSLRASQAPSSRSTGKSSASSSVSSLPEVDKVNDHPRLHMTTMTCGVCAGLLPLVDVVRIEMCCHYVCKDCLGKHVIADVDKHTFPILCPQCKIKAGNTTDTALENSVIESLGLSLETFNRYTHLQLVNTGVGIRCPRCKTGTFVESEIWRKLRIVRCPIPACRHTFCSFCYKTVRGGFNLVEELSPNANESLDDSEAIGVLSNLFRWFPKWDQSRKGHDCPLEKVYYRKDGKVICVTPPDE